MNNLISKQYPKKQLSNIEEIEAQRLSVYHKKILILFPPIWFFCIINKKMCIHYILYMCIINSLVCSLSILLMCVFFLGCGKDSALSLSLVLGWFFFHQYVHLIYGSLDQTGPNARDNALVNIYTYIFFLWNRPHTTSVPPL